MLVAGTSRAGAVLQPAVARPKSLPMSELVSTPTTFFRVPVALLHPDEVTPCDVWLRRDNGQAVLYRARDLPFTRDHRARLMRGGVREVWVSFADAAAWNAYVERHLIARVSDGEVPAEDRARVLLESARSVMQEVLDNPTEPGALARVSNVSDAIVSMTRRREQLAACIRLLGHDYYTYSHSVHVAVYSAGLARCAGIEGEEENAAIARGALIHDCGKLNLPPAILSKSGPLARDEWKLMLRHPEDGVELLDEVGTWDDVAHDMTLGHHERNDGSGYPRGVNARHISIHSRIAAIADTYDAMTSERSYQGALAGVDALKIMRREQTNRYDQQLLEIFIRMLHDRARMRE
jgi:HD-GYP domain-containing protein (c-di-GMP phosphodiesterase class II)